MRELLKRVLNARTIGYPLPPSIVKEIEAELAKPEPEPVAWKTTDIFGRALFTDSNAVYKRWSYEGMKCESLYTHPPLNEELAKPEPEYRRVLKAINEFIIDQSNLGFSKADILLEEIERELEKPEPEPIGYVPKSILGKEYNMAFCSEHPDPDVDQIPVYAEPPKRKPLSDDDFLQWLLTHDDTHELNFATVDVSTTGGKLKLHGWVKKLKAVPRD